MLLLDVRGCLGVLGVLGVEFPFCFEGGYCGNGIHCTGSWATWPAGALGVLEESLEVM